jgi:hypothetical protein
MSERSMGSEFDRKRVDGQGEQRRQQNEQSNQAGGQQGSAGGSLGAGPMTSAPDAGMEGGAVSNPPRGDGDRDANHQPRDKAQSLEQRSMGEGPVGASRDPRVGAMSRDNQQAQGEHPGPGHEGLADHVNQGLAQADPAKSVGPQRVRQAGGNDAPVERGGTANRPGDANGSGSMGSTRRDDPPRAPQR